MQRLAELLHATAVRAEVAVADARGRAHGDLRSVGLQRELEVVDEAKGLARPLGVEIAAGLRDDLRAGQGGDGVARGLPRFGGRAAELEGRDPVRGVERVARYAVRRGRAGCEPVVAKPQLDRLRGRAGEQQREKAGEGATSSVGRGRSPPGARDARAPR
jgi:hypothetical protein